MMKKILAFFMALALSLPAVANEGMWLPLLLGRNYEDMKAHGLQLTPEQLYAINQPSIKDAIVSFGGFCTGEIISKNGLILTNHHCGFEAIQTHSSVDKDYLTDGFWAKSYSEELPNEGLFVRFLVRMEDVSQRINKELNNNMTAAERSKKIAELSKEIQKEAIKDTKYEANVKSFYHGNEFYLFVYEVFNDVRLVGAPPSSVGKFGGDTDNWMWPRQTGDFSMFRVYTDKDGKSAEYSEDNIPMVPKHHLPISLDGVKEGDFTMIFGYPGSTDRYLSSYGVQQAIDKYNPTVVKIRSEKLDIMNRYMAADDLTRIQYASKHARVSNYWKYFIGQTEQLTKNKVGQKKEAIENDFRKWVNSNPANAEKYGEALSLLEESYMESDDYVASDVYVLEAGLTGSDLPLFAFRFNSLVSRSLSTKEAMDTLMGQAESEDDKKAIKDKYGARSTAIMAAINELVEEHFKNYNVTLDQEVFTSLFTMYAKDVPTMYQPTFFAMVNKKYKGDWNKFADKVYSSSFMVSEEGVKEFLENPSRKALDKDLASQIGMELIAKYRNARTSHALTNEKKDEGYRLFTAGLREMNSDKNYYPDANSTMRMTYGNVGSYYPRDGVFYDYYTTAEGILEKENPNDHEFVLPEKLIPLLKEKNYGNYANAEGELPVCFISNNDITGGNSGSPVINGKGELIGCAFDGNWEAMSGDIFFETQLQRTISVDVRYILFIVHKYAGATNLIDEMTFAKRNTFPMVDKESTDADKAVENKTN